MARAIGGMDDLRVELHRVIAAIVVGDHRIGRAGARRDDAEAGRKFGHLVAVAHPHLVRFALGPQPVEQDARIEDFDESVAEFTAVATLDAAAELRLHRLLPVTDAEQRDARIEDRLRDARRSAEQTSELQSLMGIPYAVCCLQKKNNMPQTQLT